MPTVTPTYLIDTSSQLWQVLTTNQGLLTTTAVASGTPSYTGIFLNDVTISQTWRLYVGTDGLLRDDAVASQASPTFILVNSPNLNVWKVQITDGLLMTSPGQICLPEIGSLYIPNWNNIPWQQPFGTGTTVFPQQNTGSFGYPVPGVTMQEPGQGLWTAGCGHWWNSMGVERDYNRCTGESVAVYFCPVCSFVINIVTPYEAIYEPITRAILIP